MSTVFHASNLKIEHPDVSFSRSFLDFGPGFYVTSMQDQAIKYAERFARRGQEAWLNTYKMKEFSNNCRVLTFEKYDEHWLDYVSMCRRGTIDDDVDVVIGGIANDKIFRTLDLYFSGDISKDEALRRLVYEHPNQQICFRNQQSIDNYLSFLSAEML